MSNNAKVNAAKEALKFVKDGTKLGLGTGSTANEFVKLLAKRVKDGLEVVCVPTSIATYELASSLGINLTTLEEMPKLDVTIDGADELDSKLRLIKGGGGALLREKIVAVASDRMVVIADESKFVARLGKFLLPIEINPFGMAATINEIEEIALNLGNRGKLILRKKDGDEPFITDGAHYIIDANFEQISNVNELAMALNQIPGVVEHGLFIDISDVAIIGSENGARIISA